MKKIVLYVTAGVLIFAGCEKLCKYEKRPKDLKPIDWNNYNDVYSVYWNYVFYNSPRKINEEDRGKDIMVCGFVNNFWISGIQPVGNFTIVDNTNENDPCIHFRPSFSPFWDKDSLKQLQTILNTAYIANIKCYIKGKIEDFENLTPDMGECQTYQPIITINHIDDIYVE